MVPFLVNKSQRMILPKLWRVGQVFPSKNYYYQNVKNYLP